MTNTQPPKVKTWVENGQEYYGRWVSIDIRGESIDRQVLIDINDDEDMSTPDVAKIIEAITKAFIP